MHVVATAGHVDHGKSMLVRALTGMEPDRWEAEQRRGMTIDLGFAWLTLPSGGQLAFVDVPGHERFITNMLAGVGPAPAVVFVVAADEGWMPQSAEHLAAIDALGVRHGVLVVTRADLADPGPALRQAAARIAATSLGRPEAVAVSALTGQGLPELTAALGRLVAGLPQPDPRGAVRLWLDRVFAIKGSGTVVTGTLQAGTVQAGDELVLAPAMRTVRIRGVQSLGAPAAQVSGVARVALNLRGVSTRELGRGMALVQPGRWTMTGVLDVRLAPAPAADGRPGHRGCRPGSRCTSVPPAPWPRSGCWAAGSPGWRWIIRCRCTLATGCCSAIPGRPPAAEGERPVVRRDRARRLAAPAARQRRGRGGGAGNWRPGLRCRRRRTCCAGTGCCGQPRRRPWALTACRHRSAGDWLADPAHWQRLRQDLAAAVAAHAARDPLAPGLPVDAARAGLGLPGRDLVEALAAWQPGGAARPIEAHRGYLRSADGGEDGPPADAGAALGRGRRPGAACGADAAAPAAAPRLPALVAAAVQAVLAGLADAPFRAPEAERLRELGLDARAAAAAERAGLLCRLPGNILLAPGAPERAARILASLPQPFTTSEARQALGTTRRVAIPLLEWLDRAGVTRRLADDRRTMREPPGSPMPNGEK